VHKADNLPPSYAVVTKCKSLNFLEPSGPVQAYKGTALPLCYLLSGQLPRRVFEALDDSKDVLFDHDENKYKRRSAMEWFSRWWK